MMDSSKCSGMQIVHEEYNDFVLKNAGSCFSFEALQGDASSRRYFRLSAQNGRFILCADTGVGSSISAFLKIHTLFVRREIRVPYIYAVDETAGFMLLEDLGDIHLETYIIGKPDDFVFSTYVKLIDMMVLVQSIRGSEEIPFNLFFDVEKLMFEFDFFIEHFLQNYISGGKTISFAAELRSNFIELSESLQHPASFVTTHRDYHSRNILINNGEPCVIDFQDARMGLPHYDLVSLIEDPYALLSEGMKKKLRDYYYETALEKKIFHTGRDDFDKLYDLMSYQRLVKALGTYGYMATVKKKPHFIQYIDTTIRILDSFAHLRIETGRSWRLIKGLL